MSGERDVREVLEAALRELGLDYHRDGDDRFAVALPGEKRLKTVCWLVVGRHALDVQAFVVRKPEENVEAVYRLLLQRNSRAYAVSWAIDSMGDIYLTGRVPLAAIGPEEIDRILGAVLEYADGTFNTLLELGFGSSIKREWRWRVKNNESLANLQAFREFAERAD